MSGMKSMALSLDEKREMAGPSMVADQPKYPHGLKLELSPEIMQKLGISDFPRIGEKMVMVASAEVVNVRKEGGMDDQDKISISLQIVEMDLSKPKKEDRAGDMIFSKDS